MPGLDAPDPSTVPRLHAYTARHLKSRFVDEVARNQHDEVVGVSLHIIWKAA
jgi:hypothetical protein